MLTNVKALTVVCTQTSMLSDFFQLRENCLEF